MPYFLLGSKALGTGPIYKLFDSNDRFWFNLISGNKRKKKNKSELSMK